MINLKKYSCCWLLVCVFAAVFASCSKEIMSDNDDTSTTSPADATSTLIVKTRNLSVDGADATVSYPVNVYVINSSGKCVAKAVIPSASESMDIKLAKGLYHVYAVAGAVDEKYTLPSFETASSESEIQLKDDASHGDLMVAQSTVTLGKNQTNTLTLALRRKVMQLQSIVIKDIPEGISDVTVTFSPLYSGLKLDGTYNDRNGSQTFKLSKDGQDQKKWVLAAPAYMLEATGDANITVALTQGDNVKSYTYVSKDELKANYKINITGTYNDEFELSGTVRGEEWAGEKNIEFDLTSGDEDIDTPTPGTPDSDVKDYGTPVVGQLYAQGQCYVVSEQTNDNGTVTYLLMTIKSESNFECSANIEQSVLKGKVDNLLSQIAVKGISGWRLPTRAELLAAKETVNNFNTLVDKAYQMSIYHTYFYQKNENTIAALRLDENTELVEKPGVLANAKTRAFTTLTISK